MACCAKAKDHFVVLTSYPLMIVQIVSHSLSFMAITQHLLLQFLLNKLCNNFVVQHLFISSITIS